MEYLRKILTANVYDVAQVSPLQKANGLSQRMGHDILLKREDLQPVFSFKLRGAYQKMSGLSQAAREAGVLAASAGNHAQGVALAAQRLGIQATIVMPETTPEIKHSAVARLGAEVVLFGTSFDEACAHALYLADLRQATFIHPYDDPEVITGQGTIGTELLRQEPNLDAVFVPVGGGGLLAGIAAGLGALCPKVRIIGVESADSACLAAALAADQPVSLPQVGLFADGVAVAKIGAEPFRVVKHRVDQVITVTSDEICAAIKDLFEETRAIAEPAGALALAGLKKFCRDLAGPKLKVAAVVSGANVNFHGLRYVSERAELGEGRELLLAAAIPEKPGSFRRFCDALNRRVITEFNYRFQDPDTAQVFVGLRCSREEQASVMGQLCEKGFDVVDLSGNEMAKLHLRYMVGGRAPIGKPERLVRFHFPERPGALAYFLAELGNQWNISLFHYRNHDASHGRVLAGFQVPPTEDKAFTQFLQRLGFAHVEETDNPASNLFLGKNATLGCSV